MKNNQGYLEQYIYKEIVYLKKYLYLPSSSLYKKCKELYKPSYASNERLIFSFQGAIPRDLLAHLQRVITHLDISDCFVLICNTHQGTKKLIKDVHDAYSIDEDNIFELLKIDLHDDHLVENLPDCKPLLNPPESMCMYPWTQLEFKPNGTVRPCCVYKHEIKDELGNVINLNDNNNIKFEDLYFSHDVKLLRDQFRQGKYPSGCSKCWNEEKIGKQSDRVLYQWLARDKLFNIDYESENFENLTSFNLKLGSMCNLSCRICNMNWSSSVAAEILKDVPVSEKKQHEAYLALRRGEWPKKNKNFWSELTKLLKNVDYIEFAGGEPLLSQHHWKVLNIACDLGYAENIVLRYNSNATVLPTQSQLDLWKQFKLVRLDLSIDDIEDRFDYQRYGSQWEIVQNVVSVINQDKIKNIVTQVSITINMQNVYYIPELVQWADQQNFDHVWFNHLQAPECLNLSSMNSTFQQQVIDKWNNTDFGRHTAQIHVFLDYISSIDLSGPDEFIKYTRKIDNVRNQNFADAHHEAALILGYVK